MNSIARLSYLTAGTAAALVAGIFYAGPTGLKTKAAVVETLVASVQEEVDPSMRLMAFTNEQGLSIGEDTRNLEHWLGVIITTAKSRPSVIVLDQVIDWRASETQLRGLEVLRRLRQDYGVEFVASSFTNSANGATEFPLRNSGEYFSQIGYSVPHEMDRGFIQTHFESRSHVGLLNQDAITDSLVYVAPLPLSNLGSALIDAETAFRAHFYGDPFQGVNAGDVVVIYGGDLTKASLAPTSFSLLNQSRASKLFFLEHRLEIVGIVGAVLGIGFFLFLGGWWRVSLSLACPVGVAIAGSILLSVYGIATPWMLFVLMFTAPQVTMAAIALGSRVAKQLAVHSYKVDVATASSSGIVVCLDMAGFSLIKADKKADAEEEKLRRSINRISQIVQEYGGGLRYAGEREVLCFFEVPGLEQDSADVDLSARRALKAVFAIENEVIAYNSAAIASEASVNPTRIGVTMGDVVYGEDGICGISVRGAAVENARCLSKRCESMKTLISSEVYERFAQNISGENFGSKRISDERGQDQQTFEHTPKALTAELASQITFHYMRLAKIKREHERLQIPLTAGLQLRNGKGSATILDVSYNGLGISTRDALSIGSHVEFEISAKDETMRSLIVDIGFQEVVCEVLWGRPAEDGGYVHGIRFLGLTTKQRARMQAVFQNMFKTDHVRSIEMVA